MGRTKGAKDKRPRAPRSESSMEPANAKSPLSAINRAVLPEGYNTKRIRFMQELLPTEPLDKTDVAEMERRFKRYLDLCAEWDMKIGNMAAYAAIGITREEVFEWQNRRQCYPERAEFVRKVQKVCGMYREGLMEDGKVNPVTGIFWQKNFDGMRDQQEVVITPTANPLGENPDPERLQQKYIENTYGISGEIAESKGKSVRVSAESAESAESTNGKTVESTMEVLEVLGESQKGAESK